MTVQDATRTVTVPQQAGPVDPLVTPAAEPAAAPVLGRDRPLTADERQFLLGGLAMGLGLGLYIVTGLLLSLLVWS
jgi:predicted lipid-binding transport protein (Tim44 family)